MALLETLRWSLPAALPAAAAIACVAREYRRPETRPLVVWTVLFGAVAAAVCSYLTSAVARLTGLDLRSSVAGQGSALLFVFCLVAPLYELSKVVATWPAFLTDGFGEPSDGVVYAVLASLGFAAVSTALTLHAHPQGGVWLTRAFVALPADVFFPCVWGYALGRAKQGRRRRTLILPLAWVVATAGHGLYLHIVYGRGVGALVGVAPLLLAMGGVTWVAWRDRRRQQRAAGGPATRERRPGFGLRVLAEPPSLEAVRAALQRGDDPIMVRWIFFGALVTVGAMVAGLSAAVAFGHWAHIDFSAVDEHDATTVAPLVLLGIGLLTAFPVSGFLIARASNVRTLLEPALAAALAIASVGILLGLMAPVALVFAFAFSPVAFGLSCAGAWAGLPTA